MTEKRCCFAGHKDIYRDVRLQEFLYDKCEKLIIEKNVKFFWIGNYGSFDALAARTVRKLKEKYPYIKLELILPYITKSIRDYKEMFYKNYDTITIANMPEHTPVKFRILKCNQYMVDCFDYLIAYVNRSFGGAAKTLEYAKRKTKIKIFNFGSIFP